MSNLFVTVAVLMPAYAVCIWTLLSFITVLALPAKYFNIADRSAIAISIVIAYLLARQAYRYRTQRDSELALNLHDS